MTVNKNRKVLIAALIAIIVGVPIISGLFYDSTSSSGGPDRIDAFVKSQTFVKRKLKTPATAEFPYITDSEVSVTYHEDGLYTVVAYVDAQNGFGANIRTRYRCQLKDAGDTWQLISLDTF